MKKEQYKKLIVNQNRIERWIIMAILFLMLIAYYITTDKSWIYFDAIMLLCWLIIFFLDKKQERKL